MHSIGAQITQERRKGGTGMLNEGLCFIAIKVVSLNTSQAVARVAV